MKFRSLIVAAILLASGCAPQQPPVNQQPSGVSETTKSQTNENRDRDLYECEHEAAFAGVRDKGQAFDKLHEGWGLLSRIPRHSRDDLPAAR